MSEVISSYGRIKRISRWKGCELHIEAPLQLTLLLLLIWLAGWTYALVQIIKDLKHHPSVFLTVWLCGWTFGGVYAVYTVLWIIFGKEVVIVSEGTLSIRHDVFGLGRTRRFPLASVANLRVDVASQLLFCWPWKLAEASARNKAYQGGSLVFDNLNKTGRSWLRSLIAGDVSLISDDVDNTERFGLQLDEGEARQVIHELTPYIPALQSTQVVYQIQ